MKRTLGSLKVGGVLAGCALAGCPLADAVDAAGLAGLAGEDRGALLAATCSGCHHAGPASEGAIPGLEGLSGDEIAQKLNAYRSGELRGTLMNRIARGYSQADILLLGEALGSPSE